MSSDLRQKIENALGAFGSQSLTEASLGLFSSLGYDTHRQTPLTNKTFQGFDSVYLDGIDVRRDRLKSEEWIGVDLLFQLTKDEMAKQSSLFSTDQVDQTLIESYLFLAIELSEGRYSRTQLSTIVRELNKVFPMPVMVLFRHGETLTFSVIDRRIHQRDAERDVLKKVTQIKDIRIQKPHRAHVDILSDLGMDHLHSLGPIRSFVDLHRAWTKVLDTKELNKRFYRELSDWYFWAKGQVEFPADDPSLKDRDQRNSINLIRLVTRLIFVWFLKEKALVPDRLFRLNDLKTLLKGLDPHGQSDVYYRAILQNLFFATLNQRMGERGLAPDEGFPANRDTYGVKSLYRYEDLFQVPPQEIPALFAEVPFLNGGLFDCLDNKEGSDTYIDGFSRRRPKQAVVPDRLFFGDEHEEDLNAIRGTKGKRYTVKGLIPILDAYKFTVAENTPVEEEVALDPELLGRVFENLLASYNPETQETARKKTGSFYTPREIVDYMVDESLKEVLAKSLQTKTGMTPVDARAGLDLLFEYTERDHPFEEPQTRALVEAIDQSRILDPACGSGAFPMGVLHKLVHLLSKLDPDNQRWKELQRQKAIAETEAAFRIGNQQERDRRLAEISEVFEHNKGDYGRKLYLIENCIFGVDIQPIAVQISKLRFFISLAIDQEPNPELENRGIRSLPNLETKFVAADTLIMVGQRTGGLLRDTRIDDLEGELRTLRHQYFGAKNRTQKLEYQRKDKELRSQIAEILTSDGMSKAEAALVAGFDPYDQNTHATFFHPEWMFGLKPDEKFDIVIGNPPYVQIQSFDADQKDRWIKQDYTTFGKTADLYVLFYERGFNLLATDGVLCFITSNKWMRANYGRALRFEMLKRGQLTQIIDFGDSQLFESATTYTNIAVWKNGPKAKPESVHDLSKVYKEDADVPTLLSEAPPTVPEFSEEGFVIASAAALAIRARIEKVGTPLSQWGIEMFRGILTGLNEAFIIDQAKRDELVSADPKSAEILRPILRGRDIKRYRADWDGHYLIASHNGYRSTPNNIGRVDLPRDYPAVYEHLLAVGRGIESGSIRVKGKGLFDRDDQGASWYNLRDCAYWAAFSKPKIIWPEIATDIGFVYDPSGYVFNNKAYMLSTDQLYLVAILNSSCARFIVNMLATDLQGNSSNYSAIFVEQIPVPTLSKAAQPSLDTLVECVQFAHAQGLLSEVLSIEWLLDVLVFGLYFEPELKAAHCYLNDDVQARLKTFRTDDTDEYKTQYVKKVADLCSSDPLWRQALTQVRTIPIVKTVLDAGKQAVSHE